MNLEETLYFPLSKEDKSPFLRATAGQDRL